MRKRVSQDLSYPPSTYIDCALEHNPSGKHFLSGNVYSAKHDLMKRSKRLAQARWLTLCDIVNNHILCERTHVKRSTHFESELYTITMLLQETFPPSTRHRACSENHRTFRFSKFMTAIINHLLGNIFAAHWVLFTRSSIYLICLVSIWYMTCWS